MKKFTSMTYAALVVGACAALVGCGKPGGSVQINIVKAPRIVVEAENPDAGSMEAPMVVEQVAEASGGKCLSIIEGSGKPNGERPDGSKYPESWGRAVYTVDIPSAGEYYFWARTRWDDECGNSFDVSVDDLRPEVLGGDSNYKIWQWVKGPRFQLSAGKHKVILLNREDGVKMDQFLLTTDAAYRPMGTE